MISSFCPGSRTGVENLCSLESDEELNCCGGEAINGTFGGLTNASWNLEIENKKLLDSPRTLSGQKVDFQSFLVYLTFRFETTSGNADKGVEELWLVSSNSSEFDSYIESLGRLETRGNRE